MTGMRPADIRAALRKAGHTGWSIAQQVIGRSGQHPTEQAIYMVIHGRSRSDAIAKAIADAVGLNPSDLWPSIYSEPRGTQTKPRYRLRLDGTRELISPPAKT